MVPAFHEKEEDAALLHNSIRYDDSDPEPDLQEQDVVDLRFRSHVDDYQSIPWLVAASIIVATTTSLLLGYDEGVMSGAIQPLTVTLNLSEKQADVVMGALNSMAAFGALVGGKAADAWGRKKSIVMTAFLICVGPFIMATANSFLWLMGGRLITGIGVGFAFVVPPLYAAELAPARLRGSLVAVAEVCINLGIFIGYSSAYLLQNLPTSYSWRCMLGIASIVPFIIFIISLFLPETPRWLASRDMRSEAEATLYRLYKDDNIVQHHLHSIDLMIRSDSHAKDSSWSEIFNPTPIVRRMLIAGLGIAIFQQLSGSEACVYYTPRILQEAGFKKQSKVLLMTMAVGFAKFASATFAAFTIEHKGRRPSLILSSTGIATCLLGLALAQFFNVPLVSLICLCLFMICFELGLGPLVTIIGSEIYPMRIRAKGLSLGLFLNRLISGSVSTFFPVLLHLFGSGATYLIFFAIAISGILFAYTCIPETKGLSLEEVQELFERG